MRTDVAKVLIFDDSMECVLLQREDALAPLGGALKGVPMHQEVQQLMWHQTGIMPQSQPYWWLVRSEAFPSADTYVHVFFGKVSMAELQTIERYNPKTIIVNTDRIAQGPYTIAHRLKYLIPMAMVLSQIDSRHWPKP